MDVETEVNSPLSTEATYGETEEPTNIYNKTKTNEMYELYKEQEYTSDGKIKYKSMNLQQNKIKKTENKLIISQNQIYYEASSSQSSEKSGLKSQIFQTKISISIEHKKSEDQKIFLNKKGDVTTQLFICKKTEREDSSNYPTNEEYTSKEEKKTREHPENLIIKIKTCIFKSSFDYLNKVIELEEKKYDPCSKKDLHIVKLNKKITGQIEMEKTKDYLFNGRTLGYLIKNEEVNEKIFKKDRERNRGILKYIEEKENEREFSFQVMNMKIIDLFNNFLNDQKPKLIGKKEEETKEFSDLSFFTLSNFCQKLAIEDKEYADLVRETAIGLNKKDGILKYYRYGKARPKKNKKK